MGHFMNIGIQVVEVQNTDDQILELEDPAAKLEDACLGLDIHIEERDTYDFGWERC